MSTTAEKFTRIVIIAEGHKNQTHYIRADKAIEWLSDTYDADQEKFGLWTHTNHTGKTTVEVFEQAVVTLTPTDDLSDI